MPQQVPTCRSRRLSQLSLAALLRVGGDTRPLRGDRRPLRGVRLTPGGVQTMVNRLKYVILRTPGS